MIRNNSNSFAEQKAEFAIQATNLSKYFASKLAVDAVSLTVRQGQIFGLLGPNAAGKTTMIRMLCGILDSDSGEVLIEGQSVAHAKSLFGYVAQHFGQYEELTVWENLNFYAQMYGVFDRAHLRRLLKRYQLFEFKDQFAGSLSGGYQRRLALVCALAHDPKVVFLDEPTAGIDPVTRKLLWDDFYRLSAEGKTLLVTTHYMEEAQRCHQLAFLSAGKIVAEGTPQSIRQALGDVKVYCTELAYRPELRDALQDLPGMLLINQFGDELRLVVKPKLSPQTIAETIFQVSGKNIKFSVTEANLEDVFIALTQPEHRQDENLSTESAL